MKGRISIICTMNDMIFSEIRNTKRIGLVEALGSGAFEGALALGSGRCRCTSTLIPRP